MVNENQESCSDIFYKKDVKETSTALYSVYGAIIMKKFVYSIRRAMIHKSHGMVQLLNNEIRNKWI